MSIKLPPVLPGTDHAKLCPVRDVLDHIGDRWSFLALLALAHGTHRFTELQRAIGDVSKRMLAETLRSLERDGFVTRKIYPSVPPKVEYTLTALGTSLVRQMEPLVTWADRHHTDVSKARKRYKPRAPIAPL
jgi:DNA-binding HxlR family transcriptional regulator